MKFLIFSMLVFTCVPCFSETKQEQRTCRIIFPERPANAPEFAYLFDSMGSHKIDLSRMNFSEVIHVPQGDLVVHMTAQPVAKSEDIPEDSPTLEIPDEMTHFYLVLFNDPENSLLPISMKAFDVSKGKLEPGQTLWVNLTNHHIVGELGEESLTIPPTENSVSKAPLSSSGYFKAKFTYQAEGIGEFKPVMTKSWWFDASSKNLGFITDSGNGFPSIFTFRDHRIEK